MRLLKYCCIIYIYILIIIYKYINQNNIIFRISLNLYKILQYVVVLFGYIDQAIIYKRNNWNIYVYEYVKIELFKKNPFILLYMVDNP
jgi:hypothetical protein